MDATGSQELEGTKMELYIYNDNDRSRNHLYVGHPGNTPYVITSKDYPQLVPGTKCALVETAAPDGYTITKDVDLQSILMVKSHAYMYDGATEFRKSPRKLSLEVVKKDLRVQNYRFKLDGVS